jgi:sugar/nucleoside kinase (ribokinase family)
MQMSRQSHNSIDAIVAGHLCLDIYPGLLPGQTTQSMITPGALFAIGPATMATGGAVANTGIALHRLGVKTRLMAKVGNDAFGDVTMQLISGAGAELAKGMIIAPEATSYTIVLNPSNADRTFWHHTGCNDTFTQADVTDAQLDAARDGGARLMHFGYPGLLRQFYSDGGVGLADLFARCHARRIATSLDMVWVDPNSDAGLVNWPEYLQRVMKQVDIFCPSVDELQWIFDRSSDYHAWSDRTLTALGDRLLGMGAAIVLLKLGERGLYLRTAQDAVRFAGMGRLDLGTGWLGRELLTTCFQVKVAGATGAGDCTIAGFLAALLEGCDPVEALQMATGAGASCCETIDATGGVPDWNSLKARIAAGWPKHPLDWQRIGWQWDEKHRVAIGPNDADR